MNIPDDKQFSPSRYLQIKWSITVPVHLFFWFWKSSQISYLWNNPFKYKDIEVILDLDPFLYFEQIYIRIASYDIISIFFTKKINYKAELRVKLLYAVIIIVFLWWPIYLPKSDVILEMFMLNINEKSLP